MTHLERTDTGAVFVYGQLVTATGGRVPLTLDLEDWEALEKALGAHDADDGGHCVCYDVARRERDALRPVVEAARTRAQVLRDLRQFGSGSAGWPERDRDSDCDLLAAVDALDGAP